MASSIVQGVAGGQRVKDSTPQRVKRTQWTLSNRVPRQFKSNLFVRPKGLKRTPRD